MPKLSEANRKTIDEIKELADLNLASYNLEKIFPGRKMNNRIDLSVIKELLPVIMKFLESEDHILQDDGAYFITGIIATPKKTNTKAIIESGAIPKLINLLQSSAETVRNQSLRALANIAVDFPHVIDVNQVFPTVKQCLQSKNEKTCNLAAWFLNNALQDCDKNIIDFLEVDDAVEALLPILESKNDIAGADVLGVLYSICCDSEACQYLLDHNVLKSLKKLFHRLFGTGTQRRKAVNRTARTRPSKTSDDNEIKLLAIEFIQKLMSYGQAAVEKINEEDFVPLILQLISDGMTDEIKIEAIKVIENIISTNHNILKTLINEHNLILVVHKNFESTDIDLVVAALTAMNTVIEISKGEQICLQKIRDCDKSKNFTKLLKHKNKEICRLSKLIYNFVLNGEMPPPTLSTPNNIDNAGGRRKKRLSSSANQTQQRRCKRSRILFENSSTDNRSGRNSVMAVNETSLNIYITTEQPSSDSFGIASILSPDISLAVLETAKTIDETKLIKYYPPDEKIIKEHCQQLGAQFNQNDYDAFIQKVKTAQSDSNSESNVFHTPINSSGFACLSILLTGNEESAENIKEKINDKFTNGLHESDPDKITKVINSDSLLSEHLKILSTWLKCRIIVCCYGSVEKYGDWGTEKVSTFVLAKNAFNGQTNFYIVLSLKND